SRVGVAPKIGLDAPARAGACRSMIRDLDFRKALLLPVELGFRKVLPLFPELDFRKVLPLLRRPAVRAVRARLAVARWIAVAVVPASPLEPVSLHFRQPWKALPFQKKYGIHKYSQACSQSVRCLT